MKKTFSLLFFFCSIALINAQDLYEDALTAASYAYSHSKKAHGANNVFHTQEYADKALEAFRKVENLSELCGCSEANEQAYEAIVDLESALSEDTYERSRFYVKRAKEYGENLLELLTECQANSDTAEIASSEDDSLANEAIANATEQLNKQQLELQEKQRQLELQQRQLAQQIALQNKMQAEFEAKRAKELKEQELIKSKAEMALQKLENALHEFNIVFNDGTSPKIQKDYLRTKNDLENETLNDTKTFYVNRAKELTKTAMQQFANYSEDE